MFNCIQLYMVFAIYKEEELTMPDKSGMFMDRPVSLNTKNNLLEIEEHMYILDDV